VNELDVRSPMPTRTGSQPLEVIRCSVLSLSLRLLSLCLDKLEKAEQEKSKLVAEYEELDKRVKGIRKHVIHCYY